MDRPVWPLIMFDSDGVPYGCISEVVARGYIEDFPEEFVAVFDSTGAPVEIVGRGEGMQFLLTGQSRRSAEALSRIRSYAIESKIDGDALTNEGLLPAIVKLIEQDTSRQLTKRVARSLSALWPRKRRIP